MQKFVDRAGRIWIVDIDNTTLRRVKTLTGVHLLEAIDGDLITRLSTDPLLLGDVLLQSASRKRISSRSRTKLSVKVSLATRSTMQRCTPRSIDQLLPGVATPSSAEGGREKQKLIETRGISAIEKRLDDPNLVDKLVEDLERKLAVPTLSDSSSDLPASSESIQVP